MHDISKGEKTYNNNIHMIFSPFKFKDLETKISLSNKCSDIDWVSIGGQSGGVSSRSGGAVGRLRRMNIVPKIVLVSVGTWLLITAIT